jgi:hypothetical protein
VSAALLLYSPACALAAYHSSVIISLASVTTPTRAFYQAPAVTDGRGLIAWCVMSLSEIVLLVMGAILFAAALSVAIGIASRLITVA